MAMRRLVVLSALSGSLLFAAGKKESVIVPVDLSAGPAFHVLPTPLSDGQSFLSGLAVEAFAVITPDVLKSQRDRIPKKWRRMISKDQELHIKPFYLTFLPTTFLIHRGDRHEAYAATWSLFGLNWVARPLSSLEAEFGLKLPTLTYAWIQSPRIEENDKVFWGIGATPRAQILWRITKSLHASASWDQHLYLPIATTEYTPQDRSPENWSTHGVASLKLHVRLPTTQKI